ncbi:HNH endonuclease [Spirosoma spitsbergense]|uniref:HNH endonuclease n=1 Tax=Spirosoma spitsbergense TaxID=431554 RepID=UPI0003A33581|nr:HNH endonuclease [Spirosoma spitsbergense]
MPETILQYFIYALSHLHRDMKKGGAPHKPILLLSILHEYESGRIKTNRIYVTPELTHSFSVYWSRLVETDHSISFAMPFYHMHNEKGNWWRLIANQGCEIWLENKGSMKSFGNLTAAIAYAELDPNLTKLLLDKETREILRHTLLTTYFPNRQSQADIQEDDYVSGLRDEMVEESPTEYKAKILRLKTRLDPETYQVEVYNRGTVFRREVVKIYDETCCISGLRVSATFTITMVDACYIVPFATNFDNNMTNGIALCPNLHRAFDRGLIGVDNDYRVILSKAFTENESSLFSFKQIEGQRIKLPNDKRFLPSLNGFAWHRKHTFKH